MTVKELIEQLSKCDPNHEVMIYNDYWMSNEKIVKVGEQDITVGYDEESGIHITERCVSINNEYGHMD